MDVVTGSGVKGLAVAHVASALAEARAAQIGWAMRPVAERVRVLRRFRHAAGRDPQPLLQSLQARRPPAETLAAEVLPLLEAARFLEREAAALLAPRRPRGRRPLWLAGVRSEIRRDPLGVVLILAPSNYPLMLPGIQALQALAAGNAVCVKPAPQCEESMHALARGLAAAGLPTGVFRVLASGAEIGAAAAGAGFDKIVLTGSARTGVRVLAAAAPALTPSTMELSGCDAAFVLPGADPERVFACLRYGLRLNAGATCIAPHRVFIAAAEAAGFAAELARRLAAVSPVLLPNPVSDLLDEVLAEAVAAGATVLGQKHGRMTGPLVVARAHPRLRLVREDVFAPVIAILAVDSVEAALVADRECPYALGATVFGPTNAAAAVARRVRAGSVVVNDIIVPTADPRLPFGGRHASGFGVTRGAEGLLEMTAIRTLSVRRGGFLPHLREPAPGDEAALSLLVAATHGGLRGVGRALAAVARRRNRSARG